MACRSSAIPFGFRVEVNPMNVSISQSAAASYVDQVQSQTPPTIARRRSCARLDFWGFALVIIVLNLPVLMGEFNAQLVLFPEAVAAGEWWRVLTHPFVHVTWYHLLLDGSAFLLLYYGLEETRWLRRLGYIAASGAGALLISLCAAPQINAQGLCGLSGIAHGLMAISALEMISDREANRSRKWTGILCLALVTGKSLFEFATSHVAFSFLHFGLMGAPVAVCHLGGVIGGTAAFFVCRLTVSRLLDIKGVFQ
jgi:rhomboid family GlyGly-CTERM serine protease